MTLGLSLVEAVSYLAPCILLALLLLGGRYPGEERLIRALGRRARPARRRRVPRRRRWRTPAVRRSSPLACGLAGRAPPLRLPS